MRIALVVVVFGALLTTPAHAQEKTGLPLPTFAKSADLGDPGASTVSFSDMGPGSYRRVELSANGDAVAVHARDGRPSERFTGKATDAELAAVRRALSIAGVASLSSRSAPASAERVKNLVVRTGATVLDVAGTPETFTRLRALEQALFAIGTRLEESQPAVDWTQFESVHLYEGTPRPDCTIVDADGRVTIYRVDAAGRDDEFKRWGTATKAELDAIRAALKTAQLEGVPADPGARQVVTYLSVGHRDRRHHVTAQSFPRAWPTTRALVDAIAAIRDRIAPELARKGAAPTAGLAATITPR